LTILDTIFSEKITA